MTDLDAFAELRSAHLLLRRLRLSDAASLQAYRGLPDVARFQSWERFDAADAAQLVAGQAVLRPNQPGTWFQVGIVDAGSQVLVGDCGLHFLADDPRQVEIGITLDPAHQGRGIAKEALALVLSYLFGTLDKHRVFAVTDADNAPAARLFLALAFRREAHFIENIFFKGAYGSEFLFAMVKREWMVLAQGQ